VPQCGRQTQTRELDPVDQVRTLWTNKTDLQSGFGAKRSRCLWMSEGSMLLQLDPLDHHFDPEGQAPTLWTSTSWSTGSEGMPGGSKRVETENADLVRSAFSLILHGSYGTWGL
jgi:hypothetical protein